MGPYYHMGRMHNGAQTRIGSTKPNIKRSAQWLEMFWWFNDFIIWQFPSNTTRSTAADEINACLKASNLWRYVNKLQLSVNMRVALLNDLSADDFSKQLLNIGNGRVPVDESSGLISFPPNFCNFVSSKDELINKVFPDIIANHKNTKWLSKRAILAAKNKDVDDLNFIIQNQIVGTLYSFKSIDCNKRRRSY